MTRQYNTLEDVYDTLNTIPMFSDRGRSAANFSLDGILLFCDRLGNPQNEFTSIHVAGTNGKGTTCRILASVYQSAGYNTGLFTSPHLVDFLERITMNSEWMPGDDLLHFFRKHGQIIEDINPTYFELATAIGFWYFREKNVDVAVIETGLGGRLDATNIIYPVVSVITSVGMDHTDILGDTIEQIAREKAGIIKQKTPVVVGNLPEAALIEIKQLAKKNNAPLVQTPVKLTVANPERQTLAARLNGRIVEAILHCLNDRIPVSPQHVKDGFETWTDRFPTGASFRKVHPEYAWYFDGAHNTDAFKLLKRQLTEIAPLSSWTLVFGMMRDKFTKEALTELSEIGTIYYHKLKLERAATEKEVKEMVPKTGILRADYSLPESWVQKYKSELVIFGGSFYFYKTLKQWIDNIVDR